jgi:hypothetical protein
MDNANASVRARLLRVWTRLLEVLFRFPPAGGP